MLELHGPLPFIVVAVILLVVILLVVIYGTVNVLVIDTVFEFILHALTLDAVKYDTLILLLTSKLYCALGVVVPIPTLLLIYTP